MGCASGANFIKMNGTARAWRQKWNLCIFLHPVHAVDQRDHILVYFIWKVYPSKNHKDFSAYRRFRTCL